MEDSEEHLGTALRKYRNDCGLKQYEAAKLVHLSESAYNKIERGKTPISVNRYKHFCETFSNQIAKKNPLFYDEDISKAAIKYAEEILKKLFKRGGKD
jgi:DNA-binding XRE family transcriptional regulator